MTNIQALQQQVFRYNKNTYIQKGPGFKGFDCNSLKIERKKERNTCSMVRRFGEGDFGIILQQWINGMRRDGVTEGSKWPTLAEPFGPTPQNQHPQALVCICRCQQILV